MRCKRVRDAADADDGHRVLVDRLWPRGLPRAQALVDTWLKDVAPSDDLRRWFGHDPDRFEEFARRYRDELHDSAAWSELRRIARGHDAVTLLYDARDTEHNNAAVLLAELRRTRSGF